MVWRRTLMLNLNIDRVDIFALHVHCFHEPYERFSSCMSSEKQRKQNFGFHVLHHPSPHAAETGHSLICICRLLGQPMSWPS